jgi:hypothetical protein
MGDSSNSIRRAIAARASRSKSATPKAPIAPVTPKAPIAPVIPKAPIAPVIPKASPAPSTPLPGHNLPPATVAGWITKRPTPLKNTASRNSTPKMKAAIQRAKAARARSAAEKLPPKPYLDEIIVLGERVLLNEIGIGKSTLKHATHTSELTLFSPSYFPDEKNDSKIIKAKTVFSKVFATGSKFGVDNPVPPCEVSEYNLLKEGLENRLYILRMNLPSSIEDTVSIEMRNTYEKAEQFNLVIQAIETNEAICTNYELNFDTGESKEIKGYGKLISKEERSRIQNLIRQFSFLVLQALHPVKGYETMQGDINPQFLIESLEQQQITEDDMDAYIAEYTEESNSEIPDLIAQTLEATGTQDDVYSLMLESELLNLVAYVKKSVSDNLTDAQLKMKFSGFAKSIETEPVREQVVGIMKWILAEYSTHKEIISQNLNTINLNKSLRDNLQVSISDKTESIFDLESRLAQSTAELNAAEQKIDKLTTELNKSNQDTVSSESSIIKGNRELAELLAIREGEKQKLKAELDALKLSTEKSMQKINDARVSTAVLGSALDTAANPQSLPLIKTVQKIALDIKDGKNPELKNGSPFIELYQLFNNHIKSELSLSDICYLSYFVSFFMKKIITGNIELYKIVDKLVSDYLEAHPNTIDGIIAEIRELLEITENPSVKYTGYYVLSETPSKFIGNIYNLITNELNSAAKNAFTRIFNNYYKKGVYYNQSGFIIRPVKPMQAKVFKLSGTEFKLADTPAPSDIFNKLSLPYPTLFLLYIIFAKNYLLMKNPAECLLPNYLKNPTAQKERRVSIRNTAKVI